ncbi:MAG: hypothetical protein AAGA56_17680 [Myxococcota bacterium]
MFGEPMPEVNRVRERARLECLWKAFVQRDIDPKEGLRCSTKRTRAFAECTAGETKAEACNAAFKQTCAQLTGFEDAHRACRRESK